MCRLPKTTAVRKQKENTPVQRKWRLSTWRHELKVWEHQDEWRFRRRLEEACEAVLPWPPSALVVLLPDDSWIAFIHASFFAGMCTDPCCSPPVWRRRSGKCVRVRHSAEDEPTWQRRPKTNCCPQTRVRSPRGRGGVWKKAAKAFFFVLMSHGWPTNREGLVAQLRGGPQGLQQISSHLTELSGGGPDGAARPSGPICASWKLNINSPKKQILTTENIIKKKLFLICSQQKHKTLKSTNISALRQLCSCTEHAHAGVTPDGRHQMLLSISCGRLLIKGLI